VFQYYLPQTGGNPPTVPYAALVPVAIVTNRWYIIIWVRYSPYTVFITTYHSQEIKIHYCWKLLHELLSKGGKLPEGFEWEVNDVVFGSDENISRWNEGSGGRQYGAPSTRQSKSYKKLIALCEDKANEDPDLNVLIFAVRPDRFAAEPDELGKILSEITTANKRTHVIFTECCGVDPMGWTRRNYGCLLGGRELSKSASRVNPAKSLKRADWGMEAEERVDEKAAKLKKELNAGEGEAATRLKDAVVLGKSIQLKNEPRVTKVKEAILEAQRKDKSLQTVVDVLMKNLKDKTSVVTGDEKFDILFLRWSRGQGPYAILTEEGAHCYQAACCTLLREDKAVLENLGVAKVGRLIVIMDSCKSRRAVNDGLSLVFRLVLDDQVNAVFTTRFNRINSRLFKEVCDRKKVPIIAKDCLGLSINDYIAEEEIRVEKNSEARKNLNLEHEEEAKTAFAGNHFAELVYNEMKRNSLMRVNKFIVEGLQNLTFGKSGAFEARCRNYEEYRRNMNSSITGADGQLNEDEDDSDYDYSDSDEEESD